MGRSPCCEKIGLKKGPWTPEEDQKLLAYIEEHGHGSWRALPAKAGLQRCGKSCRLRWTNYLRPDIKRGKFSLQEEQTIIQLHALLGNRWSAIATHLPKRTDNEIKNYWNTHLKKRLTKMGIDPVTHKPKSSDSLGPEQMKDAANLSHMAQWESARLEAEARLVRVSKLHFSNPFQTHVGNSASPHQLLNNAADFLPPPPPGRPQSLCLDVLTAWRGAWLKTLKDNSVSGNIYSTTAAATSNTSALESPTSTLNFSQNPFPIPADGSVFVQNSFAGIEYINNFSACEAMAMKIEAEIGKLNHHCSQDNELHFQEMGYSTEGGGAYNITEHLKAENGNTVLPDFMEGFTDILLENQADGINSLSATTNSGNCDNNVSGCCSGDLEENKTYWNNILNNLVNCSPFGSPVF